MSWVCTLVVHQGVLCHGCVLELCVIVLACVMVYVSHGVYLLACMSCCAGV